MRGTSWRRAWRRTWRRVRRHWPGKIAAVLAALVVWWVASGEPVATTQRSLLVPLEVIGAGADEVAVGVPQRVEVVITGPSERMDRLRAADVDAVLELSDVDGEFSRAIETRVPQTLRVTRVVPAEVIGRLEAVRRAEFPVEPRVAPGAPGTVLTGVALDPESVAVEARDPVLAMVAAVIAPVPALAGDEASAVLVAIDEAGRPVVEARVVPPVAQVTLMRDPRLERVVRPVTATTDEGVAATVESVLPTQVTLIGPPEILSGLPAVPASVPDVTSALAPGRYDLPLRLDLPEGVAALESVVATVRVPEPQPEAEGDDDAPAAGAP